MMTDDDFTRVALLVYRRQHDLGEGDLPRHELLRRQLDRERATVEAADAVPTLLAEIERLRARADDAESWCARLANDREGETALRAAGVAKALAALRSVRKDWANHPGGSQGARAALERKYGTINVWDAVEKAVADTCGPATLPPHEETLAENRRLRAALAEIVAYAQKEPVDLYSQIIARAALAPDPLN